MTVLSSLLFMQDVAHDEARTDVRPPAQICKKHGISGVLQVTLISTVSLVVELLLGDFQVLPDVAPFLPCAKYPVLFRVTVNPAKTQHSTVTLEGGSGHVIHSGQCDESESCYVEAKNGISNCSLPFSSSSSFSLSGMLMQWLEL